MKVVSSIPRQNNRTSVALGAFDGLHAGHMKLIRSAVAYGRENGLDACVYTFVENPAPVKCLTSNAQRERLLQCEGVDLLVLQVFSPQFQSLLPQAFLEEYLLGRLNCASVTVGFNYRFGKNQSGDVDTLRDFCKAHGIRCEVVPAVLYDGAPVSSTLIRQCVERGDLRRAADMLGRWYCVEGVVQIGDRIGHTIGFPTANVPAHKGRAMPPCGVYATLTKYRGVTYQSITNYGGKPTVRPGCHLIETHLLDFDGPLYGQTIEVAFVEKIRDITPFDNLQQLANQLEQDKQTAKQMLTHATFKDG